MDCMSPTFGKLHDDLSIAKLSMEITNVIHGIPGMDNLLNVVQAMLQIVTNQQQTIITMQSKINSLKITQDIMIDSNDNDTIPDNLDMLISDDKENINKKLTGLQEHLKWICKTQYHHTNSIEQLQKHRYGYPRTFSSNDINTLVQEQRQRKRVLNELKYRAMETQKQRQKQRSQEKQKEQAKTKEQPQSTAKNVKPAPRKLRSRDGTKEKAEQQPKAKTKNVKVTSRKFSFKMPPNHEKVDQDKEKVNVNQEKISDQDRESRAEQPKAMVKDVKFSQRRFSFKMPQNHEMSDQNESLSQRVLKPRRRSTGLDTEMISDSLQQILLDKYQMHFAKAVQHAATESNTRKPHKRKDLPKETKKATDSSRKKKLNRNGYIPWSFQAAQIRGRCKTKKPKASEAKMIFKQDFIEKINHDLRINSIHSEFCGWTE